MPTARQHDPTDLSTLPKRNRYSKPKVFYARSAVQGAAPTIQRVEVEVNSLSKAQCEGLCDIQEIPKGDFEQALATGLIHGAVQQANKRWDIPESGFNTWANTYVAMRKAMEKAGVEVPTEGDEQSGGS